MLVWIMPLFALGLFFLSWPRSLSFLLPLPFMIFVAWIALFITANLWISLAAFFFSAFFFLAVMLYSALQRTFQGYAYLKKMSKYYPNHVIVSSSAFSLDQDTEQERKVVDNPDNIEEEWQKWIDANQSYSPKFLVLQKWPGFSSPKIKISMLVPRDKKHSAQKALKSQPAIYPESFVGMQVVKI